jgi:uncharacterized membrane protein YhiD involved in acid resistance
MEMSPIIKDERGWSVDKPALFAQIIVLIIISAIGWLGNYYGNKFTVSDHEKRIAINEKTMKDQSARISEVETYVTQDKVQTKWFEEKFMFIGKALDDLRRDKRREDKR